MDYPTAGIIVAGIVTVAPFLYRALPQKQKKSVLGEADLDALDARVRLYERLKGVEDAQGHQGDMLITLTSDFKETSGTLFAKIDDLKDLILKDRQ